MAILEVQNIEKKFDHTSVLKDVSFYLEEGSALAIIGSSGSGKSRSGYAAFTTSPAAHTGAVARCGYVRQ